ncbi:hypothetical protein HYT57_03140 [Candidatus Woesearchaeota archaeon]|nr:hypothetical protein [Candidatus Woesearchaeota archaeon]
MQINIEKKHLYIFLSITILLFSSLYVIAQTFTSPAWDTSKQSHDVLYTNIITSKASTPRVVKVEGDLEITSGSGITLGGVKQTSWPTSSGSTSPSSERCVVTSFSKANTGTSTTDRICPVGIILSPDVNNYCNGPQDLFPYTSTKFADVIQAWCNGRTGAGCSIELGEAYDQSRPISDALSEAYIMQSRVKHYDLYVSVTNNGLFDSDGQSAQFIDAENGEAFSLWDPFDGGSNQLSVNGCSFKEETGAGNNNKWLLEANGDSSSSQRACRLTICKKS